MPQLKELDLTKPTQPQQEPKKEVDLPASAFISKGWLLFLRRICWHVYSPLDVAIVICVLVYCTKYDVNVWSGAFMTLVFTGISTALGRWMGVPAPKNFLGKSSQYE